MKNMKHPIAGWYVNNQIKVDTYIMFNIDYYREVFII